MYVLSAVTGLIFWKKQIKNIAHKIQENGKIRVNNLQERQTNTILMGHTHMVTSIDLNHNAEVPG
jgi:UDP-2,3-diacylglucosamine pyrophosphatase LpxH